MITARQLVRRLLELRRSGGLSINIGLNAGQSGGGHAQTSNYAQFGSNPNITNGHSQTEVNDAVGNAQLGVEVGINNIHEQRFDDVKGHVPDLHGFGNSFNSVGQSGLPQQKFDFGQQGDLSGQSRTVSGFWVPFKRRAA